MIFLLIMEFLIETFSVIRRFLHCQLIKRCRNIDVVGVFDFSEITGNFYVSSFRVEIAMVGRIFSCVVDPNPDP
jgi:hypothetical protein